MHDFEFSHPADCPDIHSRHSHMHLPLGGFFSFFFFFFPKDQPAVVVITEPSNGGRGFVKRLKASVRQCRELPIATFLPLGEEILPLKTRTRIFVATWPLLRIADE